MAVLACATPDEAPWNERRHGNGRPGDVRSSFAVDRDRVIHCDTFRELQHKTQVQSVRSASSHVGFFRTRLNHVIEVAQIARGLAAAIGANADLAEAIALAHDLGHPPFGHAGERGLSAALAEHGVLDWNANIHSLVVVDETEAAFVQFPGLDLTWAAREGIARHRTPFDEPSGFGEFAQSPNSGLESQLVDRADVMAYLAHDLDDALAGGYIAADDVELVSPMLADIARVSEEEWRRSPWPGSERQLVERRRLVAKLIGRLIGDLAQASANRMTELGLHSPEQIRASPDPAVVLSPAYEELARDLLGLLVERYYRSPTVADSDAEAVGIIQRLFEALVENPSLIPARFRESSTPLRVASYVASLNDLSATQLAEEIAVSGRSRASAPS